MEEEVEARRSLTKAEAWLNQCRPLNNAANTEWSENTEKPLKRELTFSFVFLFSSFLFPKQRIEYPTISLLEGTKNLSLIRSERRSCATRQTSSRILVDQSHHFL